MGHLRLVSVAGFVLLVVACSSPAPLTEQVPNASPLGTVPVAATARITFTNENWSLAVTDADPYKGSPVTLLGKIFLDPQRSTDQIAFQMYADPANSAQNTAVGGVPPTADLKRNDFVRVEGDIYGVLEGKNAFGATLRVPLVRASSVTKVTRADVLAPTLKTVDVNRPIRQNAITLTLTKVEFAHAEARLFVKIENAGPSKANVYTFDAVVVQGSKQLKPNSCFDCGYPDIPSGMLPGVMADTVLVFDALTATPFKFVWQGRSDNYRESFHDYVWDVAP